MERFTIIYITTLLFINAFNSVQPDQGVLVNQDNSKNELDMDVTKVELKENLNEQSRTFGIFGSPNLLSLLFGSGNSENNNEENSSQQTPRKAVVTNENNNNDNLDLKLTKIELKEKNEDRSNSISFFNFPNMLARLFGGGNEDSNNDDYNNQPDEQSESSSQSSQTKQTLNKGNKLEENQNLLSGGETTPTTNNVSELVGSTNSGSSLPTTTTSNSE
ncbi:hypothetical protein Mgra_00009559 [Meloidogyne graminicola]|uniref:Uncharacterized protein n=1 Tax=Meloidogyne graminicola TaxID=189291 RepID=A0A8S9ZDA6_9BILA|nr:hypothetical protein Mgra_00009559 [Meloidogyne graminicola]